MFVSNDGYEILACLGIIIIFQARVLAFGERFWGHEKSSSEYELRARPASPLRVYMGGLAQIIAQVAAAGGMAQFAQGLGFDLADALAGDLEILADLFQGVVLAVN